MLKWTKSLSLMGLILLSLLSLHAQDTLPYEIKLEETDCNTYRPNINEQEGETYYCGFVTVPQNRTTLDGTPIQLKFAVLRSFSETPKPDPVVLLGGGPGNSGLFRDSFVELTERFGGLRAERDIIIYDQRGVGLSLPIYDCAYTPLVDEAERPALLARLEAELGRVLAPEEIDISVDCILSHLANGIDDRNFNTITSAQDTIDLLTALGYEQYNLYGISYGTRLALVIMRDFPNHPLIRTVSLDSLFPIPEGNYDADYYQELRNLLDDVWAVCEGDPTCQEAYPNIRVRFDAIVEQLNQEPLSLDGFPFTGDDLYQRIYPFFDAGPLSLQTIPYIPLLVHELENGETHTLQGLQDGTLFNNPSPSPSQSVYDFMDLTFDCEGEAFNDALRRAFNNSIDNTIELLVPHCSSNSQAEIETLLQTMTTDDVNEVVKRLYYLPVSGSSNWLRTQITCHEEFPFAQPRDDFERELFAMDLPTSMIEEAISEYDLAIQVCGKWLSGQAEPIENEPVTSNYRTLVLNGVFDYVTPIQWAQDVADRLPNSVFAPIPFASHSLLGQYGNCAADITRDFLNNPNITPDLSCTQAQGFEFILPNS